MCALVQSLYRQKRNLTIVYAHNYLVGQHIKFCFHTLGKLKEKKHIDSYLSTITLYYDRWPP